MRKLPVAGSISSLALSHRKDSRKQIAGVSLSEQIREERRRLFPDEQRGKRRKKE